MSLYQLIRPHSWERLSKKVREKLQKLRYVGFFSSEDAKQKNMRLVIGKEGSLCLYWLVDESDGVIADALFQAYGPPALLAAGEVASELVLRKNYDQASRISADLLDQHVRDHKDTFAFPKETFSFLNQAITAIDQAAQQCFDLPYTSEYDATPIAYDFEEIAGGIPGWDDFSNSQKLLIIKEVIDKEIRPYIELDAGGVHVLDLKEERKVIISYEGACVSCHSSTGSTLNAIEQILQARVHPTLVVIAEL